MKVKVYWNLHKKIWSVMDAKTRRVIDHRSELVLNNCIMYVSESGRLRVIKEKRKNVHAMIIGTLTDLVPSRIGTKVSYNPYTQPTFTVGNEPIFSAEQVRFFSDRLVLI